MKCFINILAMRKGIIFNIDGILVDAMPFLGFYAEAKKLSIKEETNEIIDKGLPN